jgi:hypothetical protein
MKIRVNWLRPRVLTHNEKGHKIVDISLKTMFSLEYLAYDEADTYYFVVQILGFGFCLDVLKEFKNVPPT